MLLKSLPLHAAANDGCAVAYAAASWHGVACRGGCRLRAASERHATPGGPNLEKGMCSMQSQVCWHFTSNHFLSCNGSSCRIYGAGGASLAFILMHGEAHGPARSYAVTSSDLIAAATELHMQLLPGGPLIANQGKLCCGHAALTCISHDDQAWHP